MTSVPHSGAKSVTLGGSVAGGAVKERPVLAFTVQEDTEGTGGIVFAKTNAQARRQGAGEFGDGDFNSVTCRRAPWADQFAEQGWVPVRAYIDAGWWWHCTGCEKRISHDAEFEGEPDWTADDIVEEKRGVAYHNAACQAADIAYQAERVRRQDRAIARLKAVVARRFPDVVFSEKRPGGMNPHHAFACRGPKGWRVSQAVVSFDFPGMTIGPAQLRYDDMYGRKRNKPHYTVPNGDRAAFEAYAAIAKATAGETRNAEPIHRRDGESA